MIQDKTGLVGRQLEALWTGGTLTGMSDAQLLSRFAEARDATAESAFRELINRHGGLVMGVCRQVLRHSQDADDAFQATFLVLVRKARSIQVRESLGPWLYSVAYRTAQRARASASRYRSEDMQQVEAAQASPAENDHVDVRPLLHEEISRLPDKYRTPIVLCHLEGKTHAEAARLLDWPVGTVSGRLSRGRDLLKSRLERRGLGVASALFPASWLNLTQPIPSSTVESTLTAAARFATAQSVSAAVLSLTQGVLRSMLLNKIKMTAALLLGFSLAATGAGVWAHRASEPVAEPLGGQDAGATKQPETQQQPAGSQAGASNLAAGFPGLGAQITTPKAMFVGAGKNLPNLTGPRDPLPVFRTESILLVESPDGTSLEAMSLETDNPKWQRLSIPPGVKLIPIMGSDVMAFVLRGTEINHVAAFSAFTGEWHMQHLLLPIKTMVGGNAVIEEISPAIGPGSVLYQAGNDFYAFSSQKGAWGVLQLDGSEKAKAQMSSTDIEVLQGNRLYVFSLRLGKWSQGVATNLRPFRDLIGVNPKQK